MQELSASHDLSHLEQALKHCKRFNVAVDGGAHKGIWTRKLVSRFDQVIAIEPVQENYDHLPEGSLNINAALGEKPGMCKMKPGRENTGQWHITPGLEVNIIALDFLNLDVDFLKLDVEGYELYALQGARETIDRSKPLIMVEMNGLSRRYGYSDADLHNYITALGYEKAGQWNKDHLYEHSDSKMG